MTLPALLRDNLRLPVIASPLFIISHPALTLAQCKAGVVGAFPALNARPESQLDEWLDQITSACSSPFAVNLIVHKINNRLDEDLARSMATLQGVMRTELGEGLSLELSAEEASVEVVVPDRTMVLSRVDGTILRVWGVPMGRRHVPPLGTSPFNGTVRLASGEARVISRHVEHAGHAYLAAVIAPLASLRAQQAETVRATVFEILVGLVVAACGGWFVGRQTLKPLTRMARQAQRINERNPTERLTAPPVNDELGDLASSFNELLDRLAAALNSQRQFMADASHELRTPVSVVRTATQVALSQHSRASEDYLNLLRILTS